MKLLFRLLLIVLTLIAFNSSAYVRDKTPKITPVLTPSTPQSVVVPRTSYTGTYSLGWQPSLMSFTNGYYRVEESLSFGSWRTVVRSIPTSTTQYTFSGKSQGTYRYRVIACNRSFSGSDVCSGWGYSRLLSVSIGVTTPGVPATPTGSEYSSDGSYTINWSKPAGTASYYDLQERFNSGSWATVVSAKVLSKSFSNKPEGNYEYRVRACNSAASQVCSAYSNIKATSVTITPAYAAKTSAAVPNKSLPALDGSYSHDTSFGITGGSGGVSGGRASYSIPITVAPGRNGMQPSVSLNYSSQGGNGIAGMGWSLGVGSAISRCGRTEAQDDIIGGVTYSNTTDKLCYEGVRLIATYDSGALGRYRTELDSFAKVTRIGYLNDSDVAFIVETKGGLVRYYGTTSNSHVKPTGAPGSLSWLLEQEKDRAGNTIDYEYSDYGNGEVLLNGIYYTGTATTLGNRKVMFKYAQRQDFSSTYLAGGLTRQTRILRAIETYYNNSLIRSYKLGYIPSNASGKSLLQSVQECSASNSSNCLAPITLQWHDNAIQYQVEKLGYRNSSGTLIPQLQSKRKIEQVMPHGDRDGDGGLDWAHWSMDAEGKYSGNPGTESQTCRRNGFTMRMFCVDADFDRDGKTDNWKIESNILKISYNGVSYFNTPIPLNFKSDLNYSADFNGDGWPDLVVEDHTGSAPVLKLYLHTGNSSSPYTSYGQVIYNYGFIYSNGGTKTSTVQFIGDVDGNGLPDFIHATFDAPGSGFQAAPQATPTLIYLTKLNSNGNVYMDIVSIASHALTANGFEYFFHFFMDVNGDGLTDWLSWKGDSKNIYLSLNKGNATFTNWQDMGAESALAVRTYIGELIPGEPVDRSYPKYSDSFRQVDLNSDGKPELLVPGRMLVKACATLTTVGATGGSSDRQFCGDQLYGTIRTDIQSRQKYEIPIWSGDLDDGIYEWEAIYFEEQSNGSFIARKRTTPIIASATQNAAVDAFTNGLTDIVFSYGVRYTGDVTLSYVASHPLDSHGVYINRNLGTVNNGSGDRQYEIVDTLESVKNTANGYETKWNYRPLSSRDVLAQNGPLYKNNQNLETDSFYFTSSMYVVSSVETSNGVDGFNETHYRYRDAIYNYKGRGFQGFKTVIVDSQDGMRAVSDFHQVFPLSGKIEEARTCLADDNDITCSVNPLSRSSFKYFDKTTANDNVHWIVPTVSNAETFALDNRGKRLSQKITTILPTDVDQYGNVLKSETTIDNGFTKVSSTTQNNYYPVDETNWWIDKLDYTTVTTQTTEAYGSAVYEATLDPTKKIKTVYTWTPARQPDIVTVTPELGGGKARAVDTDYNTYGLPTLVKTYEPGNSQRQISMTYSNDGQTQSADGYFVYSTTNDVGHTVITKTYPEHGQPKSVTANSLTTNSNYDAFGRLEQVTPPAGAGQPSYTRFAWCDGSLGCDGVTDSNIVYKVTTYQAGTPTSTVYKDQLNRVLLSKTEGFDGTTPTFSRVEYDALGRKIFESVPSFNIDESLGTSYLSFDALGRLKEKRVSQPFGNEMQVQYSYAGSRTNITATDVQNGVSLNMSRTYSGNGQLMQTTDADFGITQYAYDAQGNPIVLSDANGVPIRAEYNALGQKKYVEDPNMGLKTFAYTSFGEVYSETDANGDTYYYDYDGIGRLRYRYLNTVPSTSNRTSAEASFNYDSQCEGLVDGQKRLDLTNGEIFSKSYGYDAWCRPIDVTTNIDGENYTVSTQYDSGYGRVKALTYPTGLTVENLYNDSGYLTHTQNAQSGYVYHQITGMDARGQIAAAKKANGVLSEGVSYHPESGQMESIYTNSVIGGEQRHRIDYLYDGFGNLKRQIVENMRASTNVVSVEEYFYDDLHRLTRSERAIDGLSEPVISYDYDKVGNLQYKDDFATSYDYGDLARTNGNGNAGPNALRSYLKNGGGTVTLGYDLNGNRTHENGVETIRYNAFNKPVWIAKNGITTSFRYGADQMRYKQIKTGKPFGVEETRYIDKVYEEIEYNNQIQKKLYIGDAIITETVDTAGSGFKIGFVHRDRLGSVVTITDENGNIIDNKSYDPFGKPRKGTMETVDPADLASLTKVAQIEGYITREESTDLTTRRGFTDHEHLDEMELIHMNGRVYDYNLGRFLSVDPFIQSPGNSQSLNPYSYIMNNPLAGTDPSGYVAEDEKKTITKEVTVVSQRPGSRIKTKSKVTVTGTSDGKGGMTVTVSGSNGSAVGQVAGQVAGKMSGAGLSVGISDIGSQSQIAKNTPTVGASSTNQTNPLGTDCSKANCKGGGDPNEYKDDDRPPLEYRKETETVWEDLTSYSPTLVDFRTTNSTQETTEAAADLLTNAITSFGKMKGGTGIGVLIRYPVFEDIKLQRSFTVVSANFYDWDTGKLVESFQRAKIPTGRTREITLDGSRRVGRNPVALVGAVPSRAEISKNRWKSNGQRQENYYDSLIR